MQVHRTSCASNELQFASTELHADFIPASNGPNISTYCLFRLESMRITSTQNDPHAENSKIIFGKLKMNKD